MTSTTEDAAIPSTDNPAHAQDLYFRALDRIAAGQPGGAVTLLRESIVLDPLFLDAQHGLIRALQDAGEIEEAIRTAQHLIGLDPGDVLAHTRLSILYQVKGMVPEAEAESTRAKLLGWKQQLRESRHDLLSNRTSDPGSPGRADGVESNDPATGPATGSTSGPVTGLSSGPGTRPATEPA